MTRLSTRLLLMLKNEKAPNVVETKLLFEKPKRVLPSMMNLKEELYARILVKDLTELKPVELRL